MACFPDAVAVIDVPSENLDVAGGTTTGPEVSLQSKLAVVEIKTSVATSSLHASHRNATATILSCVVGDETFNNYVPPEHLAQVLQQMLVARMEYCVYVSASETGLQFVLRERCPADVRQICERSLRMTAKSVVEWAHHSPEEIPYYVSCETKKRLLEYIPFWGAVNGYVHENGPFIPVKLFRHRAQSLYCRTKGGVDGVTQYRANMRASTQSLKWEQKTVKFWRRLESMLSFLAVCWSANICSVLLRLSVVWINSETLSTDASP